MIEFYTWPLAARLAVTLFFAACLLSQAMSAILSFYRRRGSLGRIVENALDFAVLAQLLVCSMLHGQVVQAAVVSLIPETGYAGLRIAVFAIITVLAIIAVATHPKGSKETTASASRPPLPGCQETGANHANKSYFALMHSFFLIVLAAGLTLPFVEALAGNNFAYIYLAAMLFWFARSIGAALSHYREIRSDLSAISVKDAVDSLHTGVMFCEKDGFILLVNAKMQHLMTALTGKVQRNGRQFYEQLTSGMTGADCKITWLEDRSVCMVLDGSVWNFSITELQVWRKDYFQLTASDITEHWRLTEELQTKNGELLRRQKELGELITNINNLTCERETQKAKMRTHDILSQRLTLLLRNIRNEQALDFELLRSLSHSLMDDLKAVSKSLPPQEELDALTATFGSVGVKVKIDGELPEGGDCGRLLTDIIHEAVANAVRHGFATQVHVQIDDRQQTCRLRITDNGYPSSGPIIEGGGISGIREKVRAFGGAVTVSPHPRFMLTIELTKVRN